MLVGKLEGKIPVRRERPRWVDNIKMDLGERGTSGRSVKTVMELRVSLNVGRFLNSCTTGSFLKRPQLHEVSYL
jgi:hypothetical protein